MIRFMILLAALISTHGLSDSGPRYVSDILYVPVRSGPSNGHRVMFNLKSGEKVRILARDGDSDYVKVKTDEKQEGWMRERYLLSEPIAAQKLEAMTKKLERMTNSQDPLKEEVEILKADLKETKAANAALLAEKTKLTEQLNEIKEVSADTLQIHQEKKALQERSEVLEKQISSLSADNAKLKSSKQNEGIKLGILAVAFGLLIGIIFPYLRPSRKPNYKLR